MAFREPHHLPREGRDPANPAGPPRQRRGITPQLHGRYPDFDVLEQAEHWDEATRKVVLDRVENVPPIRFFEPREARTLEAFCDVVTHQDAEPRIPVLNYVDERLHRGQLDLSAHCAPAVSAHAFCAVRRLRHLEYFHDHVRVEQLLFDGVPEPDGGVLRPDRSAPGLGLALKRAEAEKYAA